MRQFVENKRKPTASFSQCLSFSSSGGGKQINIHEQGAHAILSSWLPFSVFCIIIEVFDIDLVEDVEVLMVSFFAFHMIGMSSTCTNPVLYGFLNESISKDLINKIRKVCFQIKVLV